MEFFIREGEPGNRTAGLFFGTFPMMITTNLPTLVNALDRLTSVSVHDHLDTINITMPRTTDMDAVDELACDALFADPMDRVLNAHGWTLEFSKRAELRTPSDLHTSTAGKIVQYHLDAAWPECSSASVPPL